MRMVEPQKPKKFTVLPEDVEGATPKDPCNCVLAKALGRQGAVYVEVCATITSVTYRGRCERYATPPILKQGLKSFDDTGLWSLPAGTYSLNPVPPSQTRKAMRETAAARRAEGDANMFHDRNIYPRRRLPANPRQINHRELMAASR